MLGRFGLEADRYFLARALREENGDALERLAGLLEGLATLQKHYGWPIIVSTHPRSRKCLGAGAFARLFLMARFLPPFASPTVYGCSSAPIARFPTPVRSSRKRRFSICR
jgi:UDP-N-acetylglucosamine 2-epimerase (non-hydrolysing)